MKRVTRNNKSKKDR